MMKINWLNSLILLFLSSFLFSQNSDQETRYEKTAKGYTYVKDKRYKGPKDWNSGSPATMSDKNTLEQDQLENVTQNGLEDRINQTRERKKASGNGGPLQKDPKTQKGEPIQLPDIDPPDIDAPDLPDIDPPTFSESFWKTVLIIVVVVLVILLLYWLIRNYQPKERSLSAAFEEHEWNPEVISKSELELKLEAALNKENYRECVRIYFTFILKELIRNRSIHWKKEKTNFEYQLEMAGKPNAFLFNETVRIYDLIWYGEYELTRTEFEQIEPVLKQTHQKFEQTT
jgi:hypothetical protein